MTNDATFGKDQPTERAVPTDAAEATNTAVSAETDLSNPDNLVDYSTINTSDEHLAEVTFYDSEEASAEPIRQLTAETIEQYASELYDSVHQTGFLWTANPDKDSVFAILPALSQADRKALESAYASADNNAAGASLRDDLKAIFGNDDWRKAESMLNASDNRTNDAGNLMVSLSAMDDNRADAERRVIETFATLNSEQMAQLESDFQNQYDMSVTQALKSFGVSEDAMNVLSVMRVPTDLRTADQLATLAEFAVEKDNLDYLSIALRGESPAAQATRERLLSNQIFMDKLVTEFGTEPGYYGTLNYFGAPTAAATAGLDLFGALDAKENNQDLMVALDLVREGNVSLSTIALNNTGSLFGWFDNKENIVHAVEGATDSERQMFKKGFEIAQSGIAPSTEEEKAALEFYTSTQKAFQGAGDERQRAALEAKLAFGNDSFIANIVAGETAAARFAALEEISSEDWSKLADPTSGPALRSQIESLVAKYADENERSRFMEILMGKANSQSFEESQAVKRSLSEVIEQNKQNGWFFSTTYDANAIATAITSMSASQALEYQNNPEVKAQIDNFVSGSLDVNQQRYLQALLKQVEETGMPAIEGPAEKVLANAMNAVDATSSVNDVEKLLQDSALRLRLSGDVSTLSSADVALKETIQASLEKAMKDTGIIHSGRDYRDMQLTEAALADLWQDGTLSLSLKADMGLKNASFYEQASASTTQERAALLASGKISAEENQLIEIFAAQGGQLQLEDKLRAFLLGNGTNCTDFKADLANLSSEGHQQLRDAFASKFGTAFEADFLAKVEPGEREAYESLLAVGESDGRQAFYDNLEIGLESLSGLTADGSDLTLERTLDNQAATLQDFSARFEALPQELQEKSNQLFQEALQDYRDSKEQFAEKLYQAAVIVGGVGLAVGTGGLAVPALVAAAAVAAAGRIALKKAVQGEDYDLSLSNVLKDGAIGALTGGLSVLGPETLMALKGIGATASATFMNVGGQALKQGVKEGSEAILQREVNNLAGRAFLTGQPVTREAVESLATKIAAPGTDPEALVPVLMATFDQTGIKLGEQAARTLMNNASVGAREIGSWAALGGVTNVALEGGVELANGNFDVANLPQAFITGAVFGGAIAGAFKSVGMVAPLLRGGSPELPKAKFEANTGGQWTATLDNGTVLTNDTPGPWQAQLEDGSMMRRNGNSLERIYEDGSGYVNILDGKGNARQFTLVKDGMYLDAAGKEFPFYTNGELPPASNSFKFQKTAPVKAEVAEESFPWTDWQGQPMVGEAGSIRVTQPNGQTSSVTQEIFEQTYSPVPGKPGEFFKSAITNAQQLEADVAIPTLEGMGVGRKGDWMVTGPKGERYIISSTEFNQLYRTVETADVSPTFEFRKTAAVKAEVATEPFDWVDYNGSSMHAEAGDLRVTQPNGSISSVKPEIFGKTYQEIPGRPGEYRKTAITRAQQLNEDTAVNTLEGVGTGKKGDWLVTGPEGEQYIVSKQFFDANYAPVPLTVDSPAQNYVKTMTIKAELITESGPWVNPDAAPGSAPMIVNAGDYLAMPKDQAPYVIPGDYFRSNYVQLPGLSEYGRTSVTVAQVLNREAQVWSKSAGLTAGKPGDFLITRADGGQEILSSAKFKEQFTAATPEPMNREPLSIPEATGAEVVSGNQRITSWANGEIIREGNSVTIIDDVKQLTRTYVAGRLVREVQIVDGAGDPKVVTRTYPYGDIEQVSELPTLESYEQLLNANPKLRLAQELSDTKPSTHLIDTPERNLLRQQILESEWIRLNEKYKPEQGKTLHIVLGLSGSGKSTVAEEIAANMHAMVMDADDVKPLFVDDWNDGIGAASLATEANQLEAPLVAKAMERGDNIVIPAVGSGTYFIEQLIKKANEMGYTVDLSLVDIPPTEAMKRIVGRLEKGGMYVDPRYLASLGNIPAQNFGNLVEKYFMDADNQLVSSYQRINNLNKPTLVESGHIFGDAHNNGLTPEFFSEAKVSADESFVAPVQPVVSVGR